MDESKKNRLNFIQRLYRSIIDFEVYSRFIEEPLKVAIKYIAIITLLFSIIVTSTYLIKIKKYISNGIEYLDKQIENMSLKDGILSYNNDEEAIYENSDDIIPIIIVNTGEDIDIDVYKSKVNLYDYGVIFLNDKILINVSSLEDMQTIEYNELDLKNMDKDEILRLFNNSSIYITIAIVFVISEFIQYFIYLLFSAVVLAIIGQIISLILRLKIKFKSTYIIGLYALTLPTILNMLYIVLNLMTGFVIKYFDWMYTTISYIYVCVVILIIKTDFINLRKEMIRIQIEEQKSENIFEQKENTNKEPDEKDKEKEKNNEDEDKELKEQTDV